MDGRASSYAWKVNRNSKQTLTKLYRMWQSNLLITATEHINQKREKEIVGVPTSRPIGIEATPGR